MRIRLLAACTLSAATMAVTAATAQADTPADSAPPATQTHEQALADLGNAVTLGTGAGAMAGTAIGLGAGCLIGGVVGGVGGAAVSLGVLALPSALGGCLVTAAAAGAIGAVAGTVLIGAPVAIAVGAPDLNTLLTPPAPHAG